MIKWSDHLDGWYQNEWSWWSWSVWVEWCLAGGFGTTKTGRSSARRAHRSVFGQKYTFLDNLRLQVPQMFYPVEREMTLSAGDVVAARCTMVNTRDRWWHIYHILYHKYISLSNVISLLTNPAVSMWRLQINMTQITSTNQQFMVSSKISWHDRTTVVGPTGEDEMCNFYMMYWVQGKDTIQPNTCFTR